MQVLGGYGYLREYRLEQTYRDARITSIYEGANGIHERMLATRLVSGSPADAFADFLSGERGDDAAAAHREWIEARRVLLSREDPMSLAHEFYLLTRDALLTALWGRFMAACQHHSQQQRLLRVAETQMRQLSVRRTGHLALLSAA
jgi:hypothetical protein